MRVVAWALIVIGWAVLAFSVLLFRSSSRRSWNADNVQAAVGVALVGATLVLAGVTTLYVAFTD